MQHPFELQIEDLQSIAEGRPKVNDFQIVDLSSAESAQVVGGADSSAGVTADGVGPNEAGGPFTAPKPTDPGTITADGIGPNEVGGPYSPGPYATPYPGMATTLALGEEGGGGDYFPRHGGRRHRRHRY